MATNLDIDDKLIRQAMRMGKHKTKKETVNTALQEYIKMRGRLGILKFVGKVDYWPDYDYKARRRRKSA